MPVSFPFNLSFLWGSEVMDFLTGVIQRMSVFLPFVSVNWCQHWFEYFPNPPINVLSMVENVLGHHDRYLLQHFVTYGVTSQVSHMTP